MDREVPSVSERPICTGVAASHLRELAKRFEGFEHKLIAERDRKLREQEERLRACREALALLSAAVKQTSDERVESTRALQAQFTADIASWRRDLEEPLFERLKEAERQLDSLVDRVKILERQASDERERFPPIVEKRAAEIMGQLNEFQESFEETSKQQQKREEEIRGRIKEVGVSYAEMFDLEEEERIKALEDFAAASREHQTKSRDDDDALQLEIETGLTEMHQLLVTENAERTTSQDKVIAQIEAYTKRLRSAIHSIS